MPDIVFSADTPLSAQKQISKFCKKKNTWNKVVSELVSKMDYDNFKSSVGTNTAEVGSNYKDALLDVWQTMHQLQTVENG